MICENQRYNHWTSAMRRELEEAVRQAEKDIEAKHFAGRLLTCNLCGKTHSNQGECCGCGANR